MDQGTQRGPGLLEPARGHGGLLHPRWLHTGDVARIDEEGFVHIVDRAKDMIIRGGENVYCVEVEAALFEHPAVADCAVIGVPHPVLGEEVGAVVVLRPGEDVGADELARFVGERLAAFNVPSRFWFRAEPLPRNPAGKVLKRELRAELLGGAPALSGSRAGDRPAGPARRRTGSPGAASMVRVSATSRSIWAISDSVESKASSSRSRATNDTRASSP